MDDKSTFGLTSGQLARLLAACAPGVKGEDHVQSASTTEALLRAWLASPLPLDPTVPDSVPAVLGHACEELKPLSAKALGMVLLDPQTDLGVLETIKDYCKHLSNLEGSEPRHAVAITVYYTAIASALVFHTKRITRHSYRSLDRSFAMLIDKPWMSADLTEFFAKARQACQAEERRPPG